MGRAHIPHANCIRASLPPVYNTRARARPLVFGIVLFFSPIIYYYYFASVSRCMSVCVRTRVSTIYTAIHTTCASRRKFARVRCARDVDDGGKSKQTKTRYSAREMKFLVRPSPLYKIKALGRSAKRIGMRRSTLIRRISYENANGYW